MVNYLRDFDFQNTINDHSANNNPCQDQKIGILDKGKFTIDSERMDIDYLSNNSIIPVLINPIVVILESPHKKEFINKIPQGPAQGHSGRLFKNKFEKLIQNSHLYNNLSNIKADVVLVNAVQFQCSLGHKLNNIENKRLKDKYWTKCFDSGCNEDLIDRISAINPIAILNLCTKGCDNLQMKLHDYIKESKLQKINYSLGSHPSTWNFRNAYIE
ncbi:MAG: hypothetical protein AB9858_04590 [Acidaminococcaceae bacterium]